MTQNKIGNVQPYQDFTAARGSLTTGVKSGITPAMKSKLDDVQDLIANDPDLNVKDLWSARKNLNIQASKGTPEDVVAAKTVGIRSTILRRTRWTAPVWRTQISKIR